MDYSNTRLTLYRELPTEADLAQHIARGRTLRARAMRDTFTWVAHLPGRLLSRVAGTATEAQDCAGGRTA